MKMSVEHEGWLKKEGGFIKNWKDRFFVLYRWGLVVYYTDETKTVEKGQFDISLQGVKVERYADIRGANVVRFGIQVTTADRIWYLEAADAIAHDRWVDTFGDCIFRHEGNRRLEEERTRNWTATKSAIATKESVDSVRRQIDASATLRTQPPPAPSGGGSARQFDLKQGDHVVVRRDFTPVITSPSSMTAGAAILTKGMTGTIGLTGNETVTVDFEGRKNVVIKNEHFHLLEVELKDRRSTIQQKIRRMGPRSRDPLVSDASSPTAGKLILDGLMSITSNIGEGISSAVGELDNVFRQGAPGPKRVNLSKTGWCWKRSRHRQQWKRRWLVLDEDEGFLYTFKQEQEGTLLNPTEGIDLEKVDRIQNADEELGHQHTIHIRSTDEASENFPLRFETKPIMNEWYMAIHKTQRRKTKSDIKQIEWRGEVYKLNESVYARLPIERGGGVGGTLTLGEHTQKCMIMYVDADVTNEHEDVPSAHAGTRVEMRLADGNNRFVEMGNVYKEDPDSIENMLGSGFQMAGSKLGLTVASVEFHEFLGNLEKNTNFFRDFLKGTKEYEDRMKKAIDTYEQRTGHEPSFELYTVAHKPHLLAMEEGRTSFAKESIAGEGDMSRRYGCGCVVTTIRAIHFKLSSWGQLKSGLWLPIQYKDQTLMTPTLDSSGCCLIL